MSNNQPKEYDAVLGGGSQAPVDGVVLGGIEGVKRRWETANIQQKIVALSEALKYGNIGLDFVIQGLYNESKQIKSAAYSLLQDRKEPRVKEAILKYNPWQKFTCLRTLEGHSASVRSVAISPDGKTIISGSEDGTAIIRDFKTGLIKKQINHKRPIYSIVISLNTQLQRELLNRKFKYYTSANTNYENYLITALYYSAIQVLNFQGGRIYASFPKIYSSYAFSQKIPDMLVATDSHADYIVNSQVYKIRNSIKKFEDYTSTIKSLAISSNGKFIVTGSCDKTVKIWNLDTEKLDFSLTGHNGWVDTVAVSPDNQTVISGSRDKTIRIWDLQTGKIKSILKGHKDYIYSVAISPDGKTLVSGSRDKTIKIWGFNL